MPTEALPGERCVVLLETLKELEEQLHAGTDIDDGVFRAISMLLTDALLSNDNKTLAVGIKKLKDMTLICRAGVKGRLLGYIDIVYWAQRRIIPQLLLETLRAEGNLHRMVLVALAENPPKTRRQLTALCGCTRSMMEVMLHQLRNPGLIVPRLVANQTYWEITPKGREALYLSS